MKLGGSLPKWHFPLMVWATTAKKMKYVVIAEVQAPYLQIPDLILY